ncbi:MAG: hypothetical protein KY467_13785 [Gemmatimonadetes bacterium]|nr:hypothetical protein [Gemmatimonadota bacterium]
MPRLIVPLLLPLAAVACGSDAPDATTPGAQSGAAPSGPLPASCHSAYWPCVPRASDVDCARGPGDGPVFVRGPVEIITHDPYGLDDDRDGTGCDP